MDQETKIILLKSKIAFYQMLLGLGETVALVEENQMIVVFMNSENNLEYSIFEDQHGEGWTLFDGGTYLGGTLIDLIEDLE